MMPPCTTLGTAAEDSAGWWTRTGDADAAAVRDCFTFPLLGAPWEHWCRTLRSRTATVDVLIASWDSAGSLGACLNALALSSLNRLAPERLRVVVCDDGSTDSTQADLRSRRPDLDLVVVRQDHGGQAFALNAALERASADILVFCDADMLLGCGALDEIAARHERWPDVVCAGFRTDIAATDVPLDRPGIAELIHREAITGDNRVRFHMPTLAPNMMHATRWLTRLGGGRRLVDCEGMHWLRHRLVFGCLFSASRALVAAAGGMPEVVPRWGFQDSLLVARLEAAGAFVLPVTTAWGHHITHQIRHADQWFQYRRNALAYTEILQQDFRSPSWRVPADVPMVREVWSRGRGLRTDDRERSTATSPELLHALGLWDDCLDLLERESTSPHRAVIADECRWRLHSLEELASAPSAATVWHALALLRTGRSREARVAFLRGAEGSDPVARYAASASPPELQHLGALFAANGMVDTAALYRDVAVLADSR